MRRVTISFAVLALGSLSSCLASSSDPAQPTIGQVTSVKKNIGPNGDAIQVSGATVTVPKGALVNATDVIISTTNGEPAPDGFIALSSIFHCEPSGTTFAQPVTMRMPFRDDGQPATMFWSTAASPDFSDVGGTPANGVMTANVLHFSSGFVGRKKSAPSPTTAQP